MNVVQKFSWSSTYFMKLDSDVKSGLHFSLNECYLEF